VEQAAAEMDAIARDVERTNPKNYTDLHFPVVLLREIVVGDIHPLLWELSGAVLLVLLVAVSNRARAALVNQAFVNEYSSNEDPIGQRIIVDWGNPKPTEIVGVVGNIRRQGLTAEPRPTVFLSQAQCPRLSVPSQWNFHRGDGAWRDEPSAAL
jgi:hypothetical protein